MVHFTKLARRHGAGRMIDKGANERFVQAFDRGKKLIRPTNRAAAHQECGASCHHGSTTILEHIAEDGCKPRLEISFGFFDSKGCEIGAGVGAPDGDGAIQIRIDQSTARRQGINAETLEEPAEFPLRRLAVIEAGMTAV